MEIIINQDEVTKAINNTVNKAINDSLSGYDVQKTIASVISKEVAEGAIAEAIKQATSNIDTAALSKVLATEIQKATTKAVVFILHEALLTIVCKLRNIGDYSPEDKKTREELKIELFR